MSVELTLSPGPVLTDMSQSAADFFGIDANALQAMAAPVEVAVARMLAHIRETGRIEKPKTFWDAAGDGEQLLF